MVLARRRQPAVNQPLHPIPAEYAAVLASPLREHAMPQPGHLQIETRRSAAKVHGHSVIPNVSARPPSFSHLAYFGNGIVHATCRSSALISVQFRLQPFAHRLPQHRKAPVAPFLRADVREAQKVERLRLCPRRACAAGVRSAKAPNSNRRVFSGMKFQKRTSRIVRASSARNFSASDLDSESPPQSRRHSAYDDHVAVRLRSDASVWTHRSNT